MTTLAENQGIYSHNKFKRAKKTRKLYHVIGAPSIKNFKMTLQNNQIRNCPVTEKDVDLAENIFGFDVAALKGKLARTQPEQRTDDTIAVSDLIVL